MSELMLVQVRWLDAFSEEAHIGIDFAQTLNPLERSNTGYLIDKNDERVIIAFGTIWDKDKKLMALDRTLVIPKGMIIEVAPLAGG